MGSPVQRCISSEHHQTCERKHSSIRHALSRTSVLHYSPFRTRKQLKHMERANTVCSVQCFCSPLRPSTEHLRSKLNGTQYINIVTKCKCLLLATLQSVKIQLSLHLLLRLFLCISVLLNKTERVMNVCVNLKTEVSFRNTCQTPSMTSNKPLNRFLIKSMGL